MVKNQTVVNGDGSNSGGSARSSSSSNNSSRAEAYTTVNNEVPNNFGGHVVSAIFIT